MELTELRALFNEMTLAEKVGQTVQLTSDFLSESEGEITGPVAELNLSESMIQYTGSVLGLTGAAATTKLQTDYLKQSRLKIPLLFMADVIHGYQTIFPIPLGLAASWDMELAEGTAAVAAKEAATSGIHVTFSPMVDLVRDARWGRVLETTSEDPYLNEAFAQAFVRGYQGENLKEDFERVVACVKHFAAYGAPTGGRDYNTVDLSERVLRDQYLSGYQSAIDAGAKMVMTSFNTVNGIPATGNQWLLQEVLREEFAFDGVVISDWSSVREMIAHGTAADLKAAADQSIRAGLDIDMMSGAYAAHLVELAEADEQVAALVDASAWRVLQLKNELGLFEDPYRAASTENEQKTLYSEAHLELARKTAEASIVLLENKNDILPLKVGMKVALVGPKKDTGDILGSWSLNGDISKTQTLQQALTEALGEDQLLVVEEATIYEGLASYKLAELHEADVIIVALGETADMSGEAASRTNIELPKNQLLLLDELAQLGIPLVGVLFNGRPLDLTSVHIKVDGLLEAWFPGSAGSAAIANVLMGAVNPSGKLTVSFPRNVGQVPIYYNAESTGRPFHKEEAANKYVSRYLDEKNSPLYPFGYGLSYTTFDYGAIALNQSEITETEVLQAKIKVTNTGDREGMEIVQLYIRDKVAQVIRPVKELKRFEKIALAPGETKEVVFELTEADLRYVHANQSYTSDPGDFDLMIGPSSETYQQTTFSLI